ncbi:isopentenyl-diphosphate delta-isomerase [Sediminihabitans luteus]|uniref:Isopentenyl-diphosphate Delta-isomerase n=1 Tax=Sediminihabitans luteus TaxID=1138585 RepID=A0A2M9CCU6_9CELL|nr:isopentenyl-diphosphate Delta-isomerase [Sediminihabitans luteus]PJJ69212.1 isopentenyl-diphosphate delta-isomerase [Sediminihabitans luteus]GII98887.1 isopentenyl-diphosphate Delta-isomerase [Sediminihabitans luteus]
MTEHEPVTGDHVVTVDDAGHRTGTFARSAVHTTETPLHLAFSCYLLDDADRVLMTRRALVKRTWPGVWTNSFCGHPRWTETTAESIDRHASHELGVAVRDVQVALPDFRYRAVDASGVVENEVCPVYVARVVGDVAANPDEVAEHHWVDARDLAAATAATPWAFSPWMIWQLDALRAAVADAPLTAPAPGARTLARVLGL